MPIRFEQMQPFNAALIAAASRSEQANRTLPLLLQAAEAQARMRSANLNASYSRAAAVDRENYDRIQQAQNIQAAQTDDDYDRVSRERMQSDRLALEAQALQFRHASEVAQQQQRAELNSWVNQQDLTFQEKMRMDRMRTAVGEVMNDQTLTDDEKQAMVTQLRTGIDRYQMRQQAAQTQMVEQHAKLYEEQAKRQTELVLGVKRREAMAFPDRLRTEVLPEVRAMLEQQIPMDPVLSSLNPALAAQRREQQIMQAAVGRGGYQQFLQNVQTGEWEPLKRDQPKAEAAIKPQDMMKIAQDVYSGMAKEQQDAAKNESSTGWSNFDEEYERRLATVLKGMTMMDRVLRGGGQVQPNDRSGGGTGGQYKPGDQMNWPGFDPKNPPSGEPQRLVERTLRKQAEVGADERIPAQARQAYIANLGEMLNLIAKPDKTDADRKRIAELSAMERPVPPASTGRRAESMPLQRSFETGGFFAGGKQ